MDGRTAQSCGAHDLVHLHLPRMQFLDPAAQSCRIHAGGDQELPGLQCRDAKLGSHSIQTGRGSILPVIIGPKGICHYSHEILHNLIWVIVWFLFWSGQFATPSGKINFHFNLNIKSEEKAGSTVYI